MRIIYIDIDSLRPDHLGCYGYLRPTSPNIDAIASAGMRFDRYYCADSPCMPSRAGTFTGRFGIRNGVVAHIGPGRDLRLRRTPYGGPLPDNELLPRHLRRHGHDTFALSNFADRHGADWFMIGWTQFHSPNLRCGSETAAEVNAVALPWLRENAKRENYFLMINYWDAHRPYKMDPAWADRFCDVPVTQLWPNEASIQQHRTLEGPFTAHRQFRDDKSPFPLMPGAITSRTDFEQMITGYDAAIAYVDHHIGQLLEELERQGVRDETAIIISADHGDAFGEHGIYSDHVCAHEPVHRVPLIVHWPGITDSRPATGNSIVRNSDELLYNIDLAPTLCDLLGMPTPADWDGRSFADLLHRRPPRTPPRDHLVWGHGLYCAQRTVRTRSHLLLRTYHPGQYRHFKAVELYDMEQDAYLTHDIADAQPQIVRQMSHLLDAWVEEQLAKPHTGPDPMRPIQEAGPLH